MLTTALVKTRKFKVIERDRMAEILKEQGLSLGGGANGGFECDGLNLAGVDFIELVLSVCTVKHLSL